MLKVLPSCVEWRIYLQSCSRWKDHRSFWTRMDRSLAIIPYNCQILRQSRSLFPRIQRREICCHPHLENGSRSMSNVRTGDIAWFTPITPWPVCTVGERCIGTYRVMFTEGYQSKVLDSPAFPIGWWVEFREPIMWGTTWRG